MQLNLQHQTEYNTIRTIEQNPGTGICQIKIGEACYSNSVILTPTTLELWNVSMVSDLSSREFDRLAELPAEVVLLGTGSTLHFPDMALTRTLLEKNIGLEVMDTAAACRTYNILVSDGRSVVAALILQGSSRQPQNQPA